MLPCYIFCLRSAETNLDHLLKAATFDALSAAWETLNFPYMPDLKLTHSKLTNSPSKY